MGSKKKTTKQVNERPAWVEAGARQAIDLGRRIGGQQYEEYGGQRVAGLSANEQSGMDLAARSSGVYRPYFDDARAMVDRGTRSFTDPGVAQQYMNPYIQAALDPAAREIREQGSRALNAIDDRSASIGAFGGSRGALMRSEALEKTNQSISDLYKTGMAEAYDRASQLFGQERARDMMASGQIMSLGQAVQQASVADVNTLMNTGAVDRRLNQAMADFDYQQFVEGRDWDIRNLQGLIGALAGTQGSYTTSTTTTTKEKGDPLGQAIGAAATIFGAMSGNPAAAAKGSEIYQGASTTTHDFSGGALNMSAPLGDVGALLGVTKPQTTGGGVL